jgi:Flp pilus assembly protein TadG
MAACWSIMKERRGQQGTLSIELIAGCMLLVPLLLLIIDVSTLFYGSALIGSACREAARSAANGMPADLSGPHSKTNVAMKTPPYQRVVSALSNYHTNNQVVFSPTVQSITETIEAPVPAAPVYGPVIGYVTVELSTTVAPPFTIAPFPQTVSLTSQQTFPYTYVLSP